MPNFANQSSDQPFGRISRRYQLMNTVMSLGLDRVWRRAAIKALDISTDSILLDVGCGTGDMLIDAGDQCRSRIGLDPEIAMMAGLVNLDSITPICGVAESIPVGTNTINRIASSFAVRNITNRSIGFSELYRVLDTGGRGVILEFSPPIKSIMGWLATLYIRLVIPLLGWLLVGDRPAYSYLAKTIMAFPQPSTIVSELEGSGFSEVSWRKLQGGVTVLYSFTKDK